MNDVYIEAASKLGISKERVKEVYEAYWRLIRKYISTLGLKLASSIDTLQTNVNIPSLGKLHCTEEEFIKKKKHYEAKKDKANVQQDCCNS